MSNNCSGIDEIDAYSIYIYNREIIVLLGSIIRILLNSSWLYYVWNVMNVIYCHTE